MSVTNRLKTFSFPDLISYRPINHITFYFKDRGGVPILDFPELDPNKITTWGAFISDNGDWFDEVTYISNVCYAKIGGIWFTLKIDDGNVATTNAINGQVNVFCYPTITRKETVAIYNATSGELYKSVAIPKKYLTWNAYITSESPTWAEITANGEILLEETYKLYNVNTATAVDQYDFINANTYWCDTYE